MHIYTGGSTIASISPVAVYNYVKYFYGCVFSFLHTQAILQIVDIVQDNENNSNNNIKIWSKMADIIHVPGIIYTSTYFLCSLVHGSLVHD